MPAELRLLALFLLTWRPMHGPSLHSHQPACAFDRALAALAAGDAVVLVDEALDSADLVGAGAGVSAALVNFFAKRAAASSAWRCRVIRSTGWDCGP
jgi:hypothetical protein